MDFAKAWPPGIYEDKKCIIPSTSVFQIFVILISSDTLPYPKGKKNGHQRWPYMWVYVKFILAVFIKRYWMDFAKAWPPGIYEDKKCITPSTSVFQ